MTVTYASSILSGRMQVVATAIAGGRIQLGTAGMALVLSTITLPNPAATVSSVGVLTFSGTPLVDPAAAFNGFVTAARVTDSALNPIISGLTVGLVGTDIIINLQNITAGSIVTFVSGTITGR